MLGTFGGAALAKARAESLRTDGGTRSVTTSRRRRRALGHGLIGAGRRLLGERDHPHGTGVGGRV